MLTPLYASDLTDAEWALIEPLLPPEAPTGRPRTHSPRTILNAIFYQLRTGEEQDPRSHWTSLSMLAESSIVPDTDWMSSGGWRFSAGFSGSAPPVVRMIEGVSCHSRRRTA
jgi:hypothetical protein